MKSELRNELDETIAKYDLLCHPYYRAWSEGTLTTDNLREYATNYYHHVNAFTSYLDKLNSRLPKGQLSDLILSNKDEEEGAMANDNRSHAEVWLDFAEGMGAERDTVSSTAPIPEIQNLINVFTEIAENGSTAEALAAFYAYESQIPRIAAEKERGLLDRYGADDKTVYYFTLHKTFDILHANSWCEQLELETANNPEAQKQAIAGAEKTAKALWQALDGIESKRLMARAS